MERVLVWTPLGCLVGVFIFLQFTRPPFTMGQELGVRLPLHDLRAQRGRRAEKGRISFSSLCPHQGEASCRPRGPCICLAGQGSQLRPPRRRWSWRSSMRPLLKATADPVALQKMGPRFQDPHVKSLKMPVFVRSRFKNKTHAESISCRLSSL